ILALWGQEAVGQDSSGVRKIGAIYHDWWPLSPTRSGVVASGDFALCATGSGIMSVDLSNRQSPRISSTWESDTVCGIKIAKGLEFAYVSNLWGGIEVFDISNPSNLIIAGYLNITNYITDMSYSDGYLYITTGNEMFRVLYVPNGNRAVAAGFLRLPTSPSKIALGDSYAYLACGNYGLLIVDISAPLRPEIAGVWSPYGSVSTVVIRDSIAYCSIDSIGFAVLNIANHVQPELIGSIRIPVGDLELKDNFAYIASSSGIAAIDISDPTNPNQVAMREVSDVIFADLSPAQDALVMYSDSQVLTLNTSPENPLQMFGRIQSVRRFCDVVSYREFALVAEEYFGVRAFDIRSPHQPRFASALMLSDVNSISVNGNYAYTSGYRGSVRVVDISNPMQMTTVGSLSLGELSRGFKNAYDHDFERLYIGVRGAIGICGISDPRNPMLIESIGVSKINGITMAGDYLAVCRGDSGFEIYDRLARPPLFRLSHLRTQGRVSAIAADGHLLCAAIENDGIAVYNIEDYRFVRRMGELDIQGIVDDIYLQNRTAFIAMRSEGFCILDLGDLANPRIVAQYHTGAFWNYLDMISGSIAVLSEDNDIGIYDCSEALGISSRFELTPSTFLLHPAFPNPFNASTRVGYSLPTAMEAAMKVYDGSGRFVTTLAEGLQTGGAHSVVWDASRVPAGIYYLKLHAAGTQAVRKAVVVK
ncbi:MAG: T9SS type A sorting domain-containing protein, partial [Calditrichaeota bacterium]|nr:T9SS type A sorting domain-containing protein [Calditrichota bacterium]